MGSPIGVSPIGGSPNGGSPSPIGVSPNGGSPIGVGPNDPSVQMGVVQIWVVQLGLVQLGVVQMWVDPSAPVILKGKLRMLDGSPAFPSCTVSKATGTTCKLRNRDLIIIMRAILWALWCQGGPTLHIIMYRAPENCFRATMAILGHVGPFCTFLRYTH